MEKSLYNIRIEHQVLLDEVQEFDGELTPEIEAALQINEEEFDNKAQSYAFVVKSLDADISIIEKEIDRLSDLKKKKEANQMIIKTRLRDAMIQFNRLKISTPLLSISIRESKAIEIFDEMEVPDIYKVTKEVTTISKQIIKKVIEAGEEVPGARQVTNKSLQIK